MKRKKLSELLPTKWVSKVDSRVLNQEVTSVSADSKQVGPGSVFVAVKGHSQDGHRYIPDAIAKGAVLAIGEEDLSLGSSYLRVEESRVVLGALAAALNGHPSRGMLVIGVTGTSGKTTTTYLLESILKAAGHRVGVIGTVSIRIGDQVLPSTLTTPGVVELHALFGQMKQSGCTAVVMEVSSHALKQRRTASLSFDGMIFTNLTPEHLDFHPTFEDYFQSKALLFTEVAQFSIREGKHPVAVINQEDESGRRLWELLGKNAEIKRVSFLGDEGLTTGIDGITGSIDGIEIHSPLTGQFNGSNIAGAVRLAQALQISDQNISKGLMDLNGVPGRLERVPNSKGVHVWVDYAHKPDALEKVLATLRKVRGTGRLITVVGCGGDRDRQKRPVMGRIAVEGSDRVFITSDNPRTEDPLAIIQEILKGIPSGAPSVTVEPDRRMAIQLAIGEAQTGDLVLIAGKGHETYQILGTQKVHFDDREIAAEALACSIKILPSRVIKTTFE
jgi:UDP-N-acetylmuramyl-tripeptide synthetase